MQHLKDFEDFEVLGKHSENRNASELYSQYLQFKKVIQNIPLKTLQQQGFLESSDDYKALSLLFANSLEPNNQLFRKHAQANDQLISLWFSKVTSKAKFLFIDKEVPSFNRITKEQLKEIAQLSQDEKVILELPKYLFDMGILLIYQQSLPGMKLDGTVFTLASGNPVIGMSFRYPRVDYYWFTLLHELSHICLHFGQLETPILENFEDTKNRQQQDSEIQANNLSKKSFVARNLWRNCPPKYSNNEVDVINFANEMHIHPAIVAGMLRSETKKYTIYSEIINKTNVREMVFNHD